MEPWSNPYGLRAGKEGSPGGAAWSVQDGGPSSSWSFLLDFIGPSWMEHTAEILLRLSGAVFWPAQVSPSD